MNTATSNAKWLGVKGMNDILPPASAHWLWLERVVHDLMHRYGYQNVRVPIVEPTGLFVRGLGEVTDIVEKEMYSFVDAMNGDRLTLRPEGTAGVVRAVNEHAVLYDGGRRLYYMGPMFRHERPQKGRYRQFHQIGAEALGFAGPDVDIEQIVFLRDLWVALGLRPGIDVRLQLNSLGQTEERLAHRRDLIAYFESHQAELDEDSGRRLHSNPLRILDSKNPAMQTLIEGAPQLMSYLGADSLAHFTQIRSVLDALGIAYTVNPRLVRGMDYYNLTVFEWVTDKLGAQGTVCGGGRYDGLIAQLGGKAAPAVGWGLGVERLLLLLEAAGCLPVAQSPHVYAVIAKGVDMTAVFASLSALRSAGVVVWAQGAGVEGLPSLKSQFKRADSSGADFALVYGPEEVAAQQVTVKSLRHRDAPQVQQPLGQEAQWGVSLMRQGERMS